MTTTNDAVKLQERMAPGTHFIYVENTYHDSRGTRSRFAGAEMVVLSGKWVKNIDVLGMPGGFRTEIPQAAKRVQWLDDETARYEIVGVPGHFVTVMFLPEAVQS